jgi:hypothetical protein
MEQFIDFDALEAIDAAAFRQQRPYPWANPAHLLTDEGYDALYQNMPDVGLFEHKFGYRRRANQQPHDRYSLEYRPGLDIPEPWRAFIEELRGDRYRAAIGRLFGARRPEFRFHWHYAPGGCSVSPHCDARREHGSHLFYFNSEQDWDPAWGGETLVLDDGGRLDPDSAPDFGDFREIIACKSLGNVSTLLERSERGWHGVRELRCPENHMRRIFIVVVNPGTLFWKVRDRLVGKHVQRL